MKIGKENKKGMKKPLRPCLFLRKLQSHLKRHLLAKFDNKKNAWSILHLGKKTKPSYRHDEKTNFKFHNQKEIENSEKWIYETKKEYFRRKWSACYVYCVHGILFEIFQSLSPVELRRIWYKCNDTNDLNKQSWFRKRLW